MAPALSPNDLLDRFRRDAERSALRARNGLRHLSGVGRSPVGQSAKDVVWSSERAQLWRYQSDARSLTPPLLFVHSLVSRSYVFDMAAGNSLVEAMLDRGFDVFLIDWGEPDELDADNSLETYCDVYLPEMVAALRRVAGSDQVTVFGYCFGGILALLYAAGHLHDPVRSLVVMATPVDFSHLGPMAALLQDGRIDPGDMIDSTGNVPAEFVRNAFRLLQPTADLTGYADLWQNLWNDDYLKAHQTMTEWGRDHIPFPGACFLQVAHLFARENRLATGRVPLGSREVDLGDITVPFLNIVGEKDQFIPAASNAGLTDLVGSEEADDLRLPAGHVGLFVGRSAQKRNIPAMAEWLERHSDPT